MEILVIGTDYDANDVNFEGFLYTSIGRNTTKK